MDLRPYIHLVDRNRNSALILTKRLEALGYRVDYSPNADQLVAYLKKSVKPPDLILVDVLDPESDSLKIPERIKKETKIGSAIPLAVHTTLSDRALVVKSIQGGFSDYIVRPIDLELFKDRVDKLINRSPDLAEETFQCPVNEKGNLTLEIDVQVINEFGITVKSSVLFPKNTQLVVDAPVLKKLGVGPARMRVAGTEPIKDDHHVCLLTLTFVGLDAAAVRRIRQYAIQGTREKVA